MTLTKFISIIVLVILNQSIDVNSFTDAIKKNWDYKFVKTEIINQKPESAQAFLSMTKISRGNYGLSGNVTLLKGEFGANAYIEVKTFKSQRNDGDWQPLPVQITKTEFYKFMNDQYKNLLMDSLKECSNLPFIEDVYASSITEGTTFEMKNCVFKDNAATPTHFQPGFYKGEARLTRNENDLDVTVVIIVEIMAAA